MNAQKTMFTATFLSIALAIAGIHHGFFEVLQGNNPTPGFFIDSIGEEHRTWEYGGDGAITLIPNFLYTGVTAIIFSILIILWSLTGMRSGKGADVLLLLFILLTLSGGGIGHIVFFLPVWLYTRYRTKLQGWVRRVFHPRLKMILGRLWLPATLLSGLLFVMALEVSVFGYVPGIRDAKGIFTVCWGCLLLSLILLNISFIASLASNSYVRGHSLSV